MPRFQFSLGSTDALREAGAVQCDSFDDALEALAEQADVRVGDVLEIGVPGFPPARYEWVRTGKRSRGWRATGMLAA
jgi:hypothetical protein